MSLIDLQRKHPKLYARIFRKGLDVGKTLGSNGKYEITEELTKLDVDLTLKYKRDWREENWTEGQREVYDRCFT